MKIDPNDILIPTYEEYAYKHVNELTLSRSYLALEFYKIHRKTDSFYTDSELIRNSIIIADAFLEELERTKK